MTRYVTMVNVSPLPVKYLWAFILDDQEHNFSFEPQPPSDRPPSQLNQTQIQSGPWTENANDQLAIEAPAVTPKLEEVFDISPFFGSLQPGEIENTSIRFYGHPGIKAGVKAICQVENGPVYELYLHGQASFMAYRLNTHELDFGDVHFDKFATRTLTLTNAGTVPLDFEFLNLHSVGDNQPSAHIEVQPESGVCAPSSSTVITIKFIPNIPERFQQVIFLQIAHFQPDEIHLSGTGMFCRLEMNLPRYLIDKSVEQKLFEQIKDPSELNEKVIQSRLDNVIVKNYLQKANESRPSMESLDRLDLSQQPPSVHASHTSLATSTTTSIAKRSVSSKTTPILPDYVVNFDYVILGTVRQQTVDIRNPTSSNVTFQFDRFSYRNTGFSFDCDRVKNLPSGESMTITVTFDPRGANLSLGTVECRVPVEVRMCSSKAPTIDRAFRSLLDRRSICGSKRMSRCLI